MALQQGFTPKNSYVLALLTLAFIVGEISHFLFGTISREMAQDIHFGDKACYVDDDWDDTDYSDDNPCKDFDSEGECEAAADPTVVGADGNATKYCEWDYSGQGIEYQILAGPIFVVIMTVSGVIIGFFGDKVSRTKLLGVCVMVYSISGCLQAFATEYWHLIILRMGIGAGEAGVRPLGGSIIADLFDPSTRGLANGIFSWGVYIGYGLNFVLGDYGVPADIGGWDWRATFILGCAWGIPIAVVIFLLKDPKKVSAIKMGEEESDDGATAEKKPPAYEESETAKKSDSQNSSKTSLRSSIGSAKKYSLDSSAQELQPAHKRYRMADVAKIENAVEELGYWKTLLWSCAQPAMLLLFLAAAVRHTGGYSLSYNTQLYIEEYYPDVNPGLWLAMDSIIGGSFGVFFGGWFSDRVVKKYGLHSRLWILSVFLLIATPFSVGVLLWEPDGMFWMLLCYYFFSETWFAILFTVIVEIVPADVRAVVIGIFLFGMNNIGGNLPVLVDPVADAYSYRTALLIFFSGFIAASSVLFFIASLPLYRDHKRAQAEAKNKAQASH